MTSEELLFNILNAFEKGPWFALPFGRERNHPRHPRRRVIHGQAPTYYIIRCEIGI